MAKKIIIILIVLLVAGLGYFYLNKNQQLKPAQKGWETYTNKELGISFNYPPNFKVYQSDEKTLRITMDYKNLQHSGIEVTMRIIKLTSSQESVEQVEERFKVNIYPGIPENVKQQLINQKHTIQNKEGYDLIREENNPVDPLYFIRSSKGTFRIGGKFRF